MSAKEGNGNTSITRMRDFSRVFLLDIIVSSGKSNALLISIRFRPYSKLY